MVEIKRLAECTLEEAVEAWNLGFEGYFFDMKITVDQFVNRMASEGISPTLSIVAFDHKQPIGIVKSGIRTLNGKKVAWNGGTGVAPAYRSKGVGKKLIEAAINLYKNEKVDVAYLEAISENANAIKLYEKLGYSIIDDLEYLELKGPVTGRQTTPKDYRIENLPTPLLEHIPFYKHFNAWQTNWRSAKDSQAIVAYNSEGTEVGYANFRKSYNDQGEHVGTVLFQCEADPRLEEASRITLELILHVFGDFSDDIRRLIPNLPVQNSSITYAVLKELGFSPTVTQVLMRREV
ncbi:GNAT family N-acetyltransferase [Cytobacillus sp. FJAT-54145]|uniref:GNAT family N-acetyltransferase n=1 Tax=Cytobacillus spartinae TaxID=3299023 RepID=A0ABW6KFE1_9BACI